jgi:hypothetical protein
LWYLELWRTGENDVLATSASPLSDSGQIIFAKELAGGEYSANLQTFVVGASFQDPFAFFTDLCGNNFQTDGAVGPLYQPSPNRQLGP